MLCYPYLKPKVEHQTAAAASVVEINEQKSFDLLEITLVFLVINGAVGWLLLRRVEDCQPNDNSCCGNWLR